MTLTHDQLMSELAREIAAEMPCVYEEKERKVVTEMYCLQPAANRAVTRLAPTWTPVPGLDSKTFGDKHGWVGVGNVDTVLGWPDQSRTFLELKCGSDLSACVWDAVKLAAGILGGNAVSGYMLAGASSASWLKERPPVAGTELFGSKEWVTEGPEIRDKYRSWWWHWQNEASPHIPGQVARKFETVALGTFAFQITGEPWQLRLARVQPVGTVHDTWPPIETLSAASRRTR